MGRLRPASLHPVRRTTSFLIPQGLVRRSILLAALLVTLTGVGVTAVFSNALNRQVERSADHRLLDGLAMFQQDLTAERRALATAGDLLVKEPEFASVVVVGDGAALADYLRTLIRPPVDSVALISRRGEILSYVSARSDDRAPPGVPDTKAVQQALLGRSAENVGFNGENELEQSVYVPMILPGDSSVTAILLLVSVVDTAKLDAFRTASGLHVSLFNGRERVATTFREARDEPLPVTAEAEAVGQAGSTGATQVRTHNLAAGRVRSSYQPIVSVDGDIVGTVGVALPYTAILGELRSILLPGLPLIVAILFGGAALAMFLGRSLTRPVFALRDAARRLQEGDLATPIPVIADPDFLPLRDELERARGTMLRMLAELMQRESKQRELFSSIREPILVTLSGGEIESYNPAAESMFGEWRLKDRSVQQLLPFLPDSALSDVADIWQGSASNVQNRGLDVQVSHAAVLEEGGEPRHVFVIHDVSPYTELSRQREDLLHSVAHELANPLAILQSSLELLAAGGEEEDQAERDAVVASAQRTVARLHWLTRNLLNAGSIQSGRFQITRLERDLRTVVREAAASAGDAAHQRQQHLRLALPSHAVNVLVDPNFIQQAIYNLLTNASKYSPDGEQISVSLELSGNVARVSVTDRGRGIPAEKQAELFQRFYRANGHGTGVGLGLAIVKGIIEAHGGEVGLESELGAGSTFWFTLPLAPSMRGLVAGNAAPSVVNIG